MRRNSILWPYARAAAFSTAGAYLKGSVLQYYANYDNRELGRLVGAVEVWTNGVVNPNEGTDDPSHFEVDMVIKAES